MTESVAIHHIADIHLTRLFNENSRLDLSYHYDNYFKDDIDSADPHKTKIRYRDILNNVRLNYSLLLAERHCSMDSRMSSTSVVVVAVT